MKLNEFIRRYREGKGLSQFELAEKIQVSRYKLRKWEAGEGKPKSMDLENICRYFNLKGLFDISEEALGNLLGRDKSNPQPKPEMAKMKLNCFNDVDSLIVLLEEKDKRINDLQRTVTMMEKVLDMKSKELANLPFLHGPGEG